MGTTGGAWAFVGAKAKRSAPLVDRLLGVGMIVIAKGNLTVSFGPVVSPTNEIREFCGLRYTVFWDRRPERWLTCEEALR